MVAQNHFRLTSSCPTARADERGSDFGFGTDLVDRVLRDSLELRKPADEVARTNFKRLCQDFLSDPFRISSNGDMFYSPGNFNLASIQAAHCKLWELANMLQDTVPVVDALQKARAASNSDYLSGFISHVDQATSEFKMRIVNRKWCDPVDKPFESTLTKLVENVVLSFYTDEDLKITQMSARGWPKIIPVSSYLGSVKRELQEHPRIWAVAKVLWDEFLESSNRLVSKSKQTGNSG